MDTPNPVDQYAGMNKSVAELVVELQKTLDINQDQLAEKVGVSQPTISRWLKGTQPDRDQLAALAALDTKNTPADWLGIEPQVAMHNRVGSQQEVVGAERPALSYLSGTQKNFPWPRDLPVLGHVKAGKLGFFLDQGETFEMTARPPALADVLNAYAVYVHDDSMIPAFEPGWIVWVNPNRPPTPGRNVIIQMLDGQSFIKRFLRKTGKTWICKQWNPETEIKYDEAKVKSVHLVVGSDEGGGR